MQNGLNYIATWQAGTFFGSDMAEAFRAKSEKCAPSFPSLPKTRRRV